jgi:hypothetical protein
MMRPEHNRHHGAARTADDGVMCSTFGYGELSMYDPCCASCWLGHRHTWAAHDRMLARHRDATPGCEDCASEVRKAGRLCQCPRLCPRAPLEVTL